MGMCRGQALVQRDLPLAGMGNIGGKISKLRVEIQKPIDHRVQLEWSMR